MHRYINFNIYTNEILNCIFTLTDQPQHAPLAYRRGRGTTRGSGAS